MKKTTNKLWIASCLAMTVGLSVANGEMVKIEGKDGVVLDTDTKLMWLDNLDAKSVRKDWKWAMEYCENLNFVGYDNWKLPAIDILEAVYPKMPKEEYSSDFFIDSYWSSSSAIVNSDALVISRMNGYEGSRNKNKGHNLARCVRDSNFDTLTFPEFLELLKTLNKTQNSVILSSVRGSESQFFLVKKRYKNYFGTKFELEKQMDLSLGYSKTPFETIQQLTQQEIDKYLTPRKPIDITSEIPSEIQKPVLPKAPELVKGEFEKKVDFEQRVAETLKTRENQIIALQDEYRQDVENRNKIIEKLKADYEADMVAIELEQKIKKENLPQKVEEFSKQSFADVMLGVKIKDAKYDAESEIMYVDIAAINADFSKKASFKMPPMEAKNFKENIDTQQVSMTFDFENGGFVLKNIELTSTKKVSKQVEKTKIVSGWLGKSEEKYFTDVMVDEKDKIYTATLTDKDYIPETIKVAIADKKVEFDSQAQAKFTFQNPNLTDKYQVQALGYDESNQAKGLKYNDDLAPMISKMVTVAPNPKNWLFAVAIENYDEADAVIYAKNSAKSLISAMQKRLGISERNTYALIDEKATGGAIKGQLERLLENVKEGDNVYFYYSGHGIPSSENGEAFILPKDVIADYVTKEKEFMARNIYKKLSDSKAGKVVALIDSCYSGKTDGISNIKGVAAGVFKTKKVEFDKSKMVVLTAGTNGQFSNAYTEKGQRLFSYFVTKALINRPTLDINSLYQEVSVGVKDESFKLGDNKRQEPQIEGNVEMGL